MTTEANNLETYQTWIEIHHPSLNSHVEYVTVEWHDSWERAITELKDYLMAEYRPQDVDNLKVYLSPKQWQLFEQEVLSSLKYSVFRTETLTFPKQYKFLGVTILEKRDDNSR